MDENCAIGFIYQADLCSAMTKDSLLCCCLKRLCGLEVSCMDDLDTVASANRLGDAAVFELVSSWFCALLFRWSPEVS